MPERHHIGPPLAAWTAAPVLVLAALAFSSSPSRAAAPPPASPLVVVVRSARAPVALAETVSRLHGELLSLGIDVLITERRGPRPAGAPDVRAWLKRQPGESAPVAVVETVEDVASGAVDIWILDSQRGAAEVSRVALEANVDDPPGRLAIRAVEVLRSNLVAIDLAARGKRAEPVKDERVATAQAVPEPPVVSSTQAGPAPRPVRLGVEGGAGLLTSLDGVGPALLPVVRLGWTAHRWLTFQLTLAGLGTRPSIATDAGNARVAQQYATMGGCLCPEPRPLDVYVALAAGALRTAIDGRADAPEQGHSIKKWSLLLDASAGARLRLGGRTYLAMATHLQVARPYVAIHFVDTVVATTGRPNLLLTLTIGAWL